ncbi:MAG: hypothetical protein JSR60_14240 [Proteobacteria bacterium]|nr:hypothetical protein [Pseudomonadota bacterium]
MYSEYRPGADRLLESGDKSEGGPARQVWTTPSVNMYFIRDSQAGMQTGSDGSSASS